MGSCGRRDADRRNTADFPGQCFEAICNIYCVTENGDFALIAMILFGALVLLLLLLFDVLRPLYTGRPLTPRLLTLPALLIPYAVYVMNGGW